MLEVHTPLQQDNLGDATWVAIARLLRPQGRKGELLADLLTDLDPEIQFASGRLIALAKPNTTAPNLNTSPTALETHWLPVGKNAGRIVLKLTGCDSINAAELLAGQQVMVPAAEMPTLDHDTYYVSDLIGCALIDTTLGPVGFIADVQFAMSPDGKTRLPEAAPLLGLQPANTTNEDGIILIPFVQAHLESVNVSTKTITMHLPAGLLEDDKSLISDL